jgi:hypothetical protein
MPAAFESGYLALSTDRNALGQWHQLLPEKWLDPKVPKEGHIAIGHDNNVVGPHVQEAAASAGAVFKKKPA